MKKSNRLIELKNIGPKIAGRLNEVGIFTEGDLRKAGSVNAYKMVREKYPNETLPLCYYLYSFEGALLNMHWDHIGEIKKRELKEKIKNISHD